MVTIVAMLGVLLLSSIGAVLSMTTTAETRVAANFRRVQEALYAADAGMVRALDDLCFEADWNVLPSGSTLSTFADGTPAGSRTLRDGSVLNLDQQRNLANCGKRAACTVTEVEAVTADRPWGSNNPVWRLYAFGTLADFGQDARFSPFYIVVMLADDPGQRRDTLWLRGVAYGPNSLQHTVEVSVSREGTGVRVLSWRDVR